MTNSADPDQLASSLFAKTGHVVLSKRRVNFSPGFIRWTWQNESPYPHPPTNPPTHSILQKKKVIISLDKRNRQVKLFSFFSTETCGYLLEGEVLLMSITAGFHEEIRKISVNIFGHKKILSRTLIHFHRALLSGIFCYQKKKARTAYCCFLFTLECVIF